ncbi:PhzF family phenazine biosynthesis protein [Agriterribacter sp.]|uniref:PhzF family phenazine biosynthesis protein n=1 Tax=Agriterribacter sp. TaxID=2821509 RepID=UPI002D0852E2|nr:PhzF family phenazine biosynthesis protein [Agriterribacter sp.]HTN08366.1 PhzF family phenazine biosynthesis protein [Agriterribacter sp.]
MTVPIYQADAFTQNMFGGNPAAVCPLKEWLTDEIMQNIALENNLAETAFIVPENDGYHIRWFTPTVEVDLCGHATLAAAHIFFNHLQHTEKEIGFHSKSGLLKVTRKKNGQLTLDFPADRFESITDIPAAINEGLGIRINEVYKGKFDYMAVVNNQQTIEQLQPDFKTLATIKSRGVLVTARGDDADFVSRCFFPQSGIDEDPVTGSAHTLLTPYWAEVLGKKEMTAIQLSARKGYLDCELSGNRVLMSGYAVTYMKGEIIL